MNSSKKQKHPTEKKKTDDNMKRQSRIRTENSFKFSFYEPLAGDFHLQSSTPCPLPTPSNHVCEHFIKYPKVPTWTHNHVPTFDYNTKVKKKKKIQE